MVGAEGPAPMEQGRSSQGGAPREVLAARHGQQRERPAGWRKKKERKKGGAGWNFLGAMAAGLAPCAAVGRTERKKHDG
jgi:hypothetical protein